MTSISERYRLKALTCEQFARHATDLSIKAAWAEIAIEWHALSNRIAQQYDKDHELEL